MTLRHLVKVVEPCQVCWGCGKGANDEPCPACYGSGKQRRTPTAEERLDYLENQLDGFGDEAEYDRRGIIVNVREL